MAEVSATMVKELRERTGAGIMDCKVALQESGGDAEKAVEYIKKKGLAKAAKKAGAIAAEGVVHAYIHPGSRIGVLVEVNCQTDFVARTDKMKEFAKALAMHVLANKPTWVRKEEVPAEAIEKEKALILAESAEEMAKKPEAARAKIVEGRLQKYFAQHCLLEQPWIHDDKKKVEDVRKEMVASTGENVSIRRFARFEVGA